MQNISQLPAELQDEIQILRNLGYIIEDINTRSTGVQTEKGIRVEVSVKGISSEGWNFCKIMTYFAKR